jgi:UDP-glucose 4-epimerase
MKRVLVTGCNGYVGSHTVKLLKEAGYEIHGIDINIYSPNDVRKYIDNYMIGDANQFNKAYRYDAVIHLAAYISAEESVREPLKYYENNTMGTHWQLHFNRTNGCDNFIFASTAAAFVPSSPYTLSKMMAESLVKTMAKNYTIFRFFNIAGTVGEFKQTGAATHIIRIAAEAAAGKRPLVKLFGTDWETFDGTTLRDYIHVSDVADAIVKAVENPANTDYECIGAGQTYSVRQVIDTMKKVSGVDFEVVESGRRPGDAAIVTLPPDGKISTYLKCTRTLEDMCLSAYEIEKKG